MQEVAASPAGAGSRRGVWDGLVGGAPAPPGTYIVVVSVRDRSGNGARRPRCCPRSRANRRKPGITVRQITAHALEPLPRAGQRVEFFVDSRRRSYRRSIRRVGIAHVIKKGTARRAAAHRPRPAGGVGCVPAAAALGPLPRHRPFLVQAPERARLRVVVPAITWLGVDKVDDDRDGLPNTFETGGPVQCRA